MSDAGNRFSLQGIARYLADAVRASVADPPAPVMIAVGGPGGAGKSAVCRALTAELGNAAVLKLDNYRRPRAEREAAGLPGSHPKANRLNLLADHLEKLKHRYTIRPPHYDEVNGEVGAGDDFPPRQYTLLDGEHSFHPALSPLVDFLIFVEARWTLLYDTRLSRDRTLRGYDRAKALRVFIQSNIGDYRHHLLPQRHRANIIIKRHADGFSIEHTPQGAPHARN